MRPLPTLVADPSNVPDDPRQLTNEAWAAIAHDFRALSHYVLVNLALCAVDDARPTDITPP